MSKILKSESFIGYLIKFCAFMNDESQSFISIPVNKSNVITHNGKQYNVNGSLLSTHSKRFHQLFVTENLTSVSINDKFLEEPFSLFISLLQNDQIKINSTEAFLILDISKHWDSDTITEILEEYIGKKSEAEQKIAKAEALFYSSKKKTLPTGNTYSVEEYEEMIQENYLHKIGEEFILRFLTTCKRLEVNSSLLNKFCLDHVRSNKEAVSTFITFVNLEGISSEDMEFLLSDGRFKFNPDVKKEFERRNPKTNNQFIEVRKPIRAEKTFLKMQKPFHGVIAAIMQQEQCKIGTNIKITASSNDPISFVRDEMPHAFSVIGKRPYIQVMLPVKQSIASFRLKILDDSPECGWSIKGANTEESWKVIVDVPRNIASKKRIISEVLDETTTEFQFYRIEIYEKQERDRNLGISNFEFYNDQYPDGLMNHFRDDRGFLITASNNHLNYLISPRHKHQWFSSEGKNQWVQFCFHKYVLIPAIYTLKCGKMWFPRGWKLEGSLDGKNWYILDQRMDKLYFQSPLEHCMFKCQFEKPCKFIRITLTSKTNDGLKILCLSGVEFFGEFEIDLLYRDSKKKPPSSATKAQKRRAKIKGKTGVFRSSDLKKHSSAQIQMDNLDKDNKVNNSDSFGGDFENEKTMNKSKLKPSEDHSQKSHSQSKISKMDSFESISVETIDNNEVNINTEVDDFESVIEEENANEQGGGMVSKNADHSDVISIHDSSPGSRKEVPVVDSFGSVVVEGSNIQEESKTKSNKTASIVENSSANVVEGERVSKSKLNTSTEANIDPSTVSAVKQKNSELDDHVEVSNKQPASNTDIKSHKASVSSDFTSTVDGNYGKSVTKNSGKKEEKDTRVHSSESSTDSFFKSDDDDRKPSILKNTDSPKVASSNTVTIVEPEKPSSKVPGESSIKDDDFDSVDDEELIISESETIHNNEVQEITIKEEIIEVEDEVIENDKAEGKKTEYSKSESQNVNIPQNGDAASHKTQNDLDNFNDESAYKKTGQPRKSLLSSAKYTEDVQGYKSNGNVETETHNKNDSSVSLYATHKEAKEDEKLVTTDIRSSDAQNTEVGPKVDSVKQESKKSDKSNVRNETGDTHHLDSYATQNIEKEFEPPVVKGNDSDVLRSLKESLTSVSVNPSTSVVKKNKEWFESSSNSSQDADKRNGTGLARKNSLDAVQSSTSRLHNELAGTKEAEIHPNRVEENDKDTEYSHVDTATLDKLPDIPLNNDNGMQNETKRVSINIQGSTQGSVYTRPGGLLSILKKEGANLEAKSVVTNKENEDTIATKSDLNEGSNNKSPDLESKDLSQERVDDNNTKKEVSSKVEDVVDSGSFISFESESGKTEKSSKNKDSEKDFESDGVILITADSDTHNKGTTVDEDEIIISDEAF